MTSPDEITELKRRLAAAEALLRQSAERDAAMHESETRHRMLICTFTQAIWETDAAGVVVKDSPSWRAYTGQTREEWLGYGWLNAIHPDDRAFAERQWREAMAAHSVVDAEFRLRAPDGGWRWTNVRAAPIMDASGTIAKWAGLNIDIDDRKRAEAALRASEQKYRTLFENMGQGYAECELIRGADGHALDIRYLALNPALERLSGGLKAADMIGRPAREVIPDLEDTHAALYERIVDAGVPERVEYEVAALRRWYECYVYPIGGDRFISLYEDITERKKTENELRESEKRQAFLLSLSDALRPVSDRVRIQEVASRMVGEYLGADRVAYSEIEGDEMVVRRDYTRGVPSMVGRHPTAAFGDRILEAFATSGMVCVDDVPGSPELFEAERSAFAAADIASYLGSTLHKRGRFAAAFGLHQARPRVWTQSEKTLVEDVADRIWSAVERARAEAALHESEERFRQFAEASAFGFWIRRADTLVMEYVSPAVTAIYGVEPEVFHGDLKLWVALIVPEDRATALQHIERARHGEPTVHEFRIRWRSDGTFRWVRNTDFPLLDAQGGVERIGGIVEDVTDAKLAVEHQGVLLAELQHRVRNIMAMIRSIARRSADGAATVEDYRSLLEGRMMGLARVQVLLTREANAGGWLRAILEDEIGAQAHRREQFELAGPDIRLSPKAVEVLTLAFHELTTNALKYGALSVPEGRLRVEWALFDKQGRTWLALDWREEGAPSGGPVTRRGFGSDLIEGRIPYEMAGTGRITIGPGGAHCRLEFPLREGGSVLETDAPVASTVSGGTLDMAGAPDLTGHVVLVVEDDYYIAGDTAAALRGAGATVMGPCPGEDATLDLLKTEMPTHAVLDLNLGGGGPRFAVARALRERNIPFLFLTGYDPDAMSSDMADIVRLQKPVSFRAIVEAVAQL